MANLFEVGPGKTYTTNILSEAAMVTDHGAVEFAAPVEQRLFDDTFLESLDWNCDLNPTIINPLRIYAADGNDSVIWDANGGAYCLRMTINSNLNWVHIKGIQFQGATAYQLYMRYLDQLVLEECKLINANSPVLYLRYGYKATLIRCELDSGSANPLYSGQIIDFFSCRLIFGNTQAFASMTRLYGCILDGSDLLTTEDMLSYTVQSAIDVRNSVLKGGKRAIVAAATTLGGTTSADIIGTIFVGQDVGAIDLSAERFYRANVEACCFYDQGGYLLKDVNGTYSTLAELRAAGYDTLGLCTVVNPKLDIPFTGKIANTSPLIEAGIGAGVFEDYWGNKASQVYGNPSIGADFQWDTDVAPTTPDDPVLVSVVPGDTKLTITLTGESGKDYYSRVWEPNDGLSVESESFKVVGDGATPVVIDHTGLTNHKPYMVVIYGKDGTAYSDIVMDGIDYVPDTTTSLTYEKIGNIVRSRVKTQIETGQGVAVLYDNQDEASFSKPTDGSPWIRAAILPGEATQSTFGGSVNRFRKLGVLHISVYNPIEEGDKVNRELADAVVDAFRNVSASGVVFKTPSLGAAMRDGMWWRQTITCPYYADDFGG